MTEWIFISWIIKRVFEKRPVYFSQDEYKRIEGESKK